MSQVQSSIYERAILASLRISSWSARKYDKQVSHEAAAAHGAGAEAGRYNKNLIPSTVKASKTVEQKGKRGKGKTKTITVETNSHKELMAHIAAVRVWVYKQTLAWSDDGWRCLPITNWQAFTDGIREHKATYERLLSAFLMDYPQLVTDARRILNGMFRDEDYPADVRARFSFGIEYTPVPQGGDFRVSLSAREIEAIAASTEARVRAGVQGAQEDAVKRLYACVEKINARLTETRVSNRKADKGEKIPATFRDTLVENARELCDVLGRLNIADDPKLEKFRRETELLATVEADTLRDSPGVARETADRAQNILDAMTATYGAGLFGK